MESWLKKQEKHTALSAKKKLTKSDIRAITLLAIASVAIVTATKIMIFMRWSTFPDSSYFISWHPVTPWIAIIGSCLYIYCLRAKGIDFWLAYFPAVAGITYCIVELAMINVWLTPQDLAKVFQIFGSPPDWLTGGEI